MTAALLTLATPAAAELSGAINLADVGGAVPGVRFHGSDAGDYSGSSASSAGDVNGDGLADLLIGAQFADSGAGETYLVYGSATLAGSFDLNHANVTFNGIDAGDESGVSVASAGDANGDGLADLLIGAWGAGPTGDSTNGETYLVYGSSGLAGNFDLANANVTFHGIGNGDLSGHSVSSAGDFNGDGLDDLLIGAFLAARDGESGAGQTYLAYGSASLAGSFNLANADVTFNGIYDSKSGFSVSSAGDVNGDGRDDLLIGADDANPSGDLDAGQTYLVYGRASLSASFDLENADVIFNGIDDVDHSGRSVSSAGDINGDGLADLLIGADYADPGSDSQAGETYLIYGSTNLAGTFDLANADVTFSGIDVGDRSGRSVSSAGDVNGDGLADVLISAFRAGANGDFESGETYLVYGSASLAGAFDLSHADVTFQGIDAFDYSGASVSSAGDVNGDGLADLLIGAPHADPSGDLNAGETYLIYGQPRVEPPANADFDGDGDVDGADFLAWQRGLGITGPAAGNANGDETIDANDVAAWRSQFGTMPPVDGATAVPEPAAVLLALTALVSFAACRTRKEPSHL